MKYLTAALLASTAAAFAPSAPQRASTQLSETADDLAAIAKKANPIVGFFDPLDLAGQNFWDTTSEETIGFLRESEVKHGRIAMFAFVGYIVHANGITFPWPMQLDGTPFPKASSAPEAWDAISDEAKLQIFAFVGFLEFYREVASEKHYMKGGKIGEFPAFDASVIPGGALNLYDPFGTSSKNSAETKEAGLIKEINNGRLAMLGIFGFLSESKIEGSVPALKGIIPSYAGEYMAPLTKSILPSL
eukprot:CAMPEP_0202449294 /NCGR_PEP_ID=MMETSP1360-20130828/8030_1 /ASSEMBLY_ACC=CAM_ASM_000848 /TAXON_ID=515479 /ORGANISM="Licmophora paradoxa, Strain CCMP2313" /LENGTH=245 /DNA_ID=CAMNT_0049067163 /DNA_START=56 /DNA_END=793 /DNA_ORIENTATION=-